MKHYRSLIVAVCLAAATALWFASGPRDSGAEPAPAAESGRAPAAPMRVATRELRAQPVTEFIVAQGESAPNRQVAVRAETAGRIVDLPARRGSVVVRNAVVARLSEDDRPARLHKAQALVQQRLAEHDAVEQLAAQGHVPRTQVQKARADLAAARADLAAIELDIRNLTLRAPFDGILNSREVEAGDFVVAYDRVFTLVDNNPLIVVINVSQHDIGAVAVGKTAQVRLTGGHQSRGVVRYVSATADSSTRTFSVEIEMANPDYRLPAGVGAEVSLAARSVEAHAVSPAWLARSDDGDVGVFVSDAGRARFAPVRIVRVTPQEMWVSGLPASPRVVTTGQGFVRDGAAIEAVADGAGATHNTLSMAQPSHAGLQ